MLQPSTTKLNNIYLGMKVDSIIAIIFATSHNCAKLTSKPQTWQTLFVWACCLSDSVTTISAQYSGSSLLVIPYLNIPDSTIVSKLRHFYYILCNGGAGSGRTVGGSWNYGHEVEEEGDISFVQRVLVDFLWNQMAYGLWLAPGCG